jgi:uncharacterized protein (UPF0276 family)
MPISVHIMSSRFLQLSPAALDRLAGKLRLWLDALHPLYVSDHLAVHELNGQLLPELAEADYSDHGLFHAIERWQELLGSQLLLENYPSGSAEGAGQVAFFAELHRRLQVHPLLDFSNAIIAERNGGARAHDWLEGGLPIGACHISGYRPAELDGEFLIDSHDCAVSPASWQLLEHSFGRGRGPATLVVERDGQLDHASWAADLRRAREVAAMSTQ